MEAFKIKAIIRPKLGLLYFLHIA